MRLLPCAWYDDGSVKDRSCTPKRVAARPVDAMLGDAAEAFGSARVGTGSDSLVPVPKGAVPPYHISKSTSPSGEIVEPNSAVWVTFGLERYSLRRRFSGNARSNASMVAPSVNFCASVWT